MRRERGLLFGLEALPAAAATHDGLHEGEESVAILARFHGAYFVLSKEGKYSIQRQKESHTLSALSPFQKCSSFFTVEYGVRMSMTPR